MPRPSHPPDPMLLQIAQMVDRVWCALHSPVGDVDSDSLKALINSGLTVPQMIALHMLQHEGVCTVGDIAIRAQLSRPATSHLVDRLVALELIIRSEDPEDRRQKQISLGPRAKALLGKISQEKQARMVFGMEPLSLETRRRLMAVLGDVLRELQQEKES